MRKCYCIHCMTVNDTHDKVCKKCGETLRPVDQQLKEFVYGETQSYIEDEIKGKFTDLLIQFIKSHIYGIVVSISVVTMVVINIVAPNAAEVPSDKIVTERPSVFSGSNYTDLQSITEDFLSDVYLGKNTDKYRYHTYYQVNEDVLQDNYDFFYQSSQLIHSRYPYYLNFILQKYPNDFHDSKEKIYNQYSDPETADSFYGIQQENIKNAVTDRSLLDDLDEIKIVAIDFCKCVNAECTGTPWECERFTDEGVKPYYHLSFVKRDSNWYLLKVAKDTSDVISDPTYLGYINENGLKVYTKEEIYGY